MDLSPAETTDSKQEDKQQRAAETDRGTLQGYFDLNSQIKTSFYKSFVILFVSTVYTERMKRNIYM